MDCGRDALMLLRLGGELRFPPTSPRHVDALYASLFCVRRCLAIHQGDIEGESPEKTQLPFPTPISQRDGLQNGHSIAEQETLTPAQECAAWTMRAEIGMCIARAGLSDPDNGAEWARGIEAEIEDSIGKGILLARQHPKLHVHAVHLTLLHSQLALWQNDVNFSRSLLRKLIKFLSPRLDSPHTYYLSHLTLHANLLSTNDTTSAIRALQTLRSLAETNGDNPVAHLALVLHLQACASASLWEEAEQLLTEAEAILNLVQTPSELPSSQEAESKKTPLELSLSMHTLIVSIVLHTRKGAYNEAGVRLTVLHNLLDLGGTADFKDGTIQIPLVPQNGTHQSDILTIQTTHPRILYELTFLMSAIAKHDPVGRNPRRKVFALEGLAISETGGGDDEVEFSRWSGAKDVQAVEETTARIRADLLCELAVVCIMRSEFSEAESHLNMLTAHTRTYILFDSYASQIALFHAWMAHSMGDWSRARECYRVAAYLSSNEPVSQEAKGVRKPKKGKQRGKNTGKGEKPPPDVESETMRRKDWDDEKERAIHAASQAGEAGLAFGLASVFPSSPSSPSTGRREQDVEKMRSEAIAECRGVGGAVFDAVARVLEVCSVSSPSTFARDGDVGGKDDTKIVRTKKHLKAALDLTSLSHASHLRALVLALVASLYMHTGPEHAEGMLRTCRQVAAGLGAPQNKKGSEASISGSDDAEKVGNVELGVWVGRQLLELYARHGDSDKMKKQESVNRVLERTLERQVYRRGIPSPLFPEIGCTPPAKPSGRLTNHFHKPGKTISRGCVAAAEKDGDSGMGESVISVDEEDEVRMQLDG